MSRGRKKPWSYHSHVHLYLSSVLFCKGLLQCVCSSINQYSTSPFQLAIYPLSSHLISLNLIDYHFYQLI